MSTRIKPRGLALLAGFVLTIGAGAAIQAAPASARSAPIHLTQSVNIRPGPSVASGNPLGGIPAGASPDFNCWAQGQNINGVNVWFNVNYNGVTGYYASYYDDSSYSTDAQITSKYGIPQCGGSGGGGGGGGPVFATMNDQGGVYWRSAPDWNTPVAQSGNGHYPGTRVSVQCYARGGTVPGSQNVMWVQASWVSGPGHGAGWINEHMVDDGAPINQAAAGVPPCNSSGGGGGGGGGLTAAEQGAINWARPFADRHDTSYNGLCLTFVFRAYSAAGVNLRNWVTVPIGSETYPQDIWGHFSHGHTGGGTPPAGALVFYKATNGDRHNSHVVLSTGGGNLISTADRVAGYTHYENIGQHGYAIYQGWWLPDQ